MGIQYYWLLKSKANFKIEYFGKRIMDKNEVHWKKVHGEEKFKFKKNNRNMWIYKKYQYHAIIKLDVSRKPWRVFQINFNK